MSSSRSPARVGKAQHPKEQSATSGPFNAFCHAPIETSSSPRRMHATASLVQCGSAIDHPKLRVYSQFGPGSDDFRKAPVIHRKPRYPRESLIIQELRREQKHLLDIRNCTEALPRPQSARYALPYPTALLTSSGSARDAQSIIRQRKLEAASSTASRSLVAFLEGTLTSRTSEHTQLPLPAVAPSPTASLSYPTSPRRADGQRPEAHESPMASSRSVSPRDASPCHPLLPSLFDSMGTNRNRAVSSQSQGSRRTQRQRPLIVCGIDRPPPTVPLRTPESPRCSTTQK
jgi:hypothetical protein